GEPWRGGARRTPGAACSGIGEPAAFRLRSYSRRPQPPAPSALCARRHGTCTRPASTAGLAARFCRRGRGRLREPFPAHALGMDRIGPWHCTWLLPPADATLRARRFRNEPVGLGVLSSLSPLASFSCCRGRSTAGSSHYRKLTAVTLRGGCSIR